MTRLSALLATTATIGTSISSSCAHTPAFATLPSSRHGSSFVGGRAKASVGRSSLTRQNLFFNNSDRTSSVDSDRESMTPSSTNENKLQPFESEIEENNNFLASFLKNMQQSFQDGQSNSQKATSQPKAIIVETEEEKLKRLRLERLAQIESGEIRRQNRVSEDKFAYLLLFALQLLPLLGSDRFISIAYFFGVATTTVYLGGRQEVVDAPERVSRENALYAPIGASLAIGGLYLLLKIGLDPTALYAVGVSLFGALAISDIGVPILRNVVPREDWSEAEVPIPEGLAKKLDLDKAALPLDGVLTLGLGVICTLVYWSPAVMEQKFLVSNAIAWSLGMVSLGAISLGSFQTGAILLAGLFCYDIFWVFGTDVMMTVATKVEAPVKFLYTAPPSDTPKSYNFSVLGLGDVVIPGLFVRFMSKVDEVLKPKNLSYFSVATGAYALGLGACFFANEVTHAGQPALLYLDPSLVGSALACAAANNQLEDVWNFKEEEEEDATTAK